MPEIAWPDFRFLGLARKVQYGYCLLPHEARQESCCGGSHPSTLPGLNSANSSSVAFDVFCPAYRAISRLALRFQSRNDLQTSRAFRATFRGLRTKGFSERISRIWLRVCLSHSSPNLHKSNFIVHGGACYRAPTRKRIRS